MAAMCTSIGFEPFRRFLPNWELSDEAPRLSDTEQTRARLLDLEGGEEDFGRPLGCVTTSFTFDAELFEEQCLARFLSIQSNPNETAKAYLIEREEKLSQCFACVLVDGAHVAPDRSLRWHMLPVTLPRGGVLHAKLTLLAWENCIRILIGSANLTEPAYRRNQEVMAVLDFGRRKIQIPSCSRNVSPSSIVCGGLRRVLIGPGGPQAALANSYRPSNSVLVRSRRQNAMMPNAR